MPLQLLGLLTVTCFAGLAWPESRPSSVFELSQTDLRYYQAWGISREEAEFHYQILQARETVAGGDVKAGLVHLERALELKPDSVETHYGLGAALVHLDRPREALPHFQKVVGTGSDLESRSHTQLGQILGRMGRRDEALVHFETAALLNPDRAEVRYNLGVSLFRHGRLDDALVQLGRAVELDPTLAQAHRWLASTYLELDRHVQAIGHYEALLRINEHDPTALHDLGVVYVTLGNEALARSSFERALELAKKSPRYRALQKQLEGRLATP